MSQFPPSTTLYNVALQWLKEDRENRRELEKNGRKTRGARRDQVRFQSFQRRSYIDLIQCSLGDSFRFRNFLQEVCYLFIYYQTYVNIYLGMTTVTKPQSRLPDRAQPRVLFVY